MEEIVAELAKIDPYYEYRFHNMFSPDSVIECFFCHADDYNGPVIHKDDCLWVQAKEAIN